MPPNIFNFHLNQIFLSPKDLLIQPILKFTALSKKKIKILPQNKDFRFPIHKIDKTEKSPPKLKFAPKTKM